MLMEKEKQSFNFEMYLSSKSKIIRKHSRKKNK